MFRPPGGKKVPDLCGASAWLKWPSVEGAPAKAAVVGVGSMGQNHARVYSELEGVELVGVCDRQAERANRVASRFGCLATTELDELLSLTPHVLSIAVPTSLHHEVALAAIEAGVPVLLIEKPISDDFDHAAQVIATARRKGTKIFVGHIERFNPAVRVLKELIEQGRLGEVLSIANLRVGQYNERILDTGIILDLGSHDVDLISFLYGERVEAVAAVASTSVHERGYEDHASILLRFPGERSGICELSWLSPYKVRNIFVTGEERFALVDLIQQKVTLLGESPEVVPVPKEEPLRVELRAAVDCYLRDATPEVTAEDSIHCLKVCNAAISAYRTGKVVEV